MTDKKKTKSKTNRLIIPDQIKRDVKNHAIRFLQRKEAKSEMRKYIDKKVEEFYDDKITKKIVKLINESVLSVVTQKFALGYYTDHKYNSEEIALHTNRVRSGEIESSESLSFN